MSDKAKVIWISGNLHERKLLLGKIKEQFLSADKHILDGDYSVAYLERVIRQNSVFISDKFVIIRSMPKPTGTRQTMVNQLKKLIEDIPDSCLVVFDGIAADSEKAISSHVAKHGKLFAYSDKIDVKLAPEWVMSVFLEHGKDIDIENATLLVNTSGHDAEIGGIGIDLLRIAINKISLYLGRRKLVTVEDVQLNIFPSEEVVIWSIFDALDNKNLSECYNAFARLIEKEQSVAGAINLLYNISLSRYRLLMFLKEGLAQNKSKQQVFSEATSMLKLSQSGKDWRMKMTAEISESGQQKMMFNEFAVNAALFGGFGNKPPTIDLYSRKEIVRIVNCIESGLGEIRARSHSNAAMSLMADTVFLAACTQVDDKILEDLKTPYLY